MYTIVGYNGPRTKNSNTIYDVSQQVFVDKAKLTLKANEIDDLEITVNNKNHWLYTHHKPFKTHVEVYDDKTLIFRGRMLKPTNEMQSSGLLSHTYTFESIEAYLLDSAQRFYVNADMTATDLLKHILKWHNKDVSVSHQVEIRKNDFEKDKKTHYIKIEPTTTWSALNNILVKKFGGKLNFFFDSKKHKNYLDYLDTSKKEYTDSISHTSPMLKIGSNLKSITYEQDPTNVITRLVPLGAEIKPKKVRLGDDTTLETDSEGHVIVSGATKKVHGSWRSAIRNAAKLMDANVTATDVKNILGLIQQESSGNEKAVNGWDSNAKKGTPSKGLLQFIKTTFDHYAVKGFTNWLSGFDQLMAFFNIPTWKDEATKYAKYKSWSPPFLKPRFTNGPPHKYTSKKHLKTLNKWGWPFPSAGKGSFMSGQLFGYHAGNGRRNNFHDGLDFGSVDHQGSAVHAIHGGSVIKVDYDPYIGWYILTHSSDGYDIIYQEAFSSKSQIKKTSGSFKTGDVLGYRDTSHLHIGICKKPYKWSDGYSHSFEKWHWLDPLKLIEHGGQKGDKASSAKYYTPKKTGERINIKSVNKGKDYLLAGKPILKTNDMLDAFGYIAKNKVFDDAKTPGDLLKKAKAWLKKQETNYNKESYKISALELPRFDKFKVGHLYPTSTMGMVLNKDKYLQIVQKEIDIPNSPYNSSLEIGERRTGIADYQVETNNTFKKQIESLEHSMLGLSQTVSSVQSDSNDLEDKVDANRDHADAQVSRAKGNTFFLRKDFKKYQKDVKKQNDKNKKDFDKFKETLVTKKDLEQFRTEIVNLINSMKGDKK